MPTPAPKPGVCVRCGRPVLLDRFTLCRDCRGAAGSDLERARVYLDDNPGAGPEEIAHATGADLGTLKRFFQSRQKPAPRRPGGL